jgi:phospholipid/cholesterol/gamma-HCH transport system substrate-binding protein
MSGPGRFRYLPEAVGAFVLMGLVIFTIMIVQAGRLREWFDPGENLRLVLPDEGLFGLSQGAQIEILGTPAGEIVRIVIEPDQKIHAEAKIRAAMTPFVRRDSQAVIRKRFGIAGEAYLEITRGFGKPLNWEYAVLTAKAEQAPTDTLGELIEELRARVFPILSYTEQATRAVAELTESFANPDGSLQSLLDDMSTLTGRFERGEGAFGRLLADDTAAREFEALLASTNRSLQQLEPILGELQETAKQITGLTTAFNTQIEQLPAMINQFESVLVSVDSILNDLRQTTPELPTITRNLQQTTADVPVLLGMTQKTLVELESLLRQLRSNWLLGGGGEAPSNRDGRIPAEALHP